MNQESIKKIHSFVPTVSALGFNNPEFNWSKAVGDRDLVCTDEIPFDNYYGTTENTVHTLFTDKSIDWLYGELEADTINGPFPSPTVYLTNKDILGDQLICANETKTYSFEACKSPGKVTWDISEKLGIVSSTEDSVTVKPINSNVYGNATSKATTSTQTIQKDTFIGKPSFTMKGSKCYSTSCQIEVANTNEQGILSVEWKKLDGNASISSGKYSATINGDSQGWGFYGEVTVKNSCGSTSRAFVVTSEGGLEQY